MHQVRLLRSLLMGKHAQQVDLARKRLLWQGQERQGQQEGGHQSRVREDIGMEIQSIGDWQVV